MGARTAVLLSTLVALVVVLPAAAGAATDDGARVTGTVFLDLDRDGTRDDGEPGRAGVRITLRTSATILDATTSAADGTWTFNNVHSGTYNLVIESPIEHRITGGTLPELSPETGEATLEVGSADIDAGALGVGSSVTSGPDVATTVTLDEEASPPGEFRWEVTAHNLGPDDAEGPVDLRLVLSSEHETTGVNGPDWNCEQSATIVLCETSASLPAGTSLPPLALGTGAVGDVGATVSVTATARLDGVFDAAPLNDEDTATATIDGEVAATDLDGDGTADLTDAGASTTGMLVAALLAVVVGGAALGATRRDTRRP